MLFCDFYKKLKKAMGDAEFKKLPPDKGSKYQKIFMLMTLSVNDKSNGDYLRTYIDLLKDLKNTFIKLKNDLENLKDSLHELKKEAISLDNGEESLDSLKDRIIVFSTIKDKNILHPEISVNSFIKYNDILKGVPPVSIKEFIECIPFERLKDNLIGSFKEILNKNPQSSPRDIVEASLNKDIDLLKSKFYKACIDNNNSDSLLNLLRRKYYTEPFVNSFESYKDKNSTKEGRMANFIKILKEGLLYRNSSVSDFNEIVDIIRDILKNTFIDIYTENLTDILDKNRILISRFIPEASSINGLVDDINKDIKAIDFSELNKFVVEVEEEERRAEEARKRVAKEKKEAAKKDAEELIRKEKEEAKRVDEEYKRMAEKCKKFKDLFNKNDIQMIHRYSKYLGFSLKKDFPAYSDISYRQIKEYVNYLYFWLNKNKDETFKKYCQGDSISNFAEEITPYLVSRPYFIDVINNLPDEQKKKVYEEFMAEITTVSLDDSLDSLDFLGEELSALLKKIIGEAKNKALQKDLIILEKLWEKEENDFLEMVLYPILYDLCDPDSNTDFARYSFCLKILNEKIAVVKENHPDTFLDNLFFFIAKKKKIFFDDFKLENIQPSRVYIGGVVYKGTTFDEIYGNKNENKNENKTVLSCGLGPLMFDLSNFFTEEKNNKASFTDLKQILKFKKTLKNGELYDYDDSFVLIDLTRALVEYVKKNKNKIGRNLHYVNPKRYWEQERFWEEKRTSELYKYIHEKLETEKAQSHISTRFQGLPFKSLRNYYLQGECPAYGKFQYMMDMWDYPGKGS